MKTIYLTFLLACLHLLLLAQQPGTLDSSFGRNGRQYDTVAPNARYPALLVQPDGKIIIGGQGFLQYIKTFRIDRLLPNGSPDLTFGDSGTVLVKFSLVKNEYNHKAAITCMALQPDGKIVAGGYYQTHSRYNSPFIVMRFLNNGSIDSSFGINGITKPTLKGYTGSGAAMLVQPDGKIVIGGTYEPYFGAINQAFLERLLPEGKLDVNFGNKGQVIDTFGEVHALALQPDGNIIAAGTTGNPFFTTSILLRRYLPDGTLDTRFGNNGTVDTTVGYHTNSISDLALQPDGKMVIAGYVGVYPNTYHFMTGRYNSNGTIDKTFGKGGISYTLFSGENGDASAYANKVMLWNHKIIAAGYRNTTGTDVIMVAYNSNGMIDSSFASKGIQEINYDQQDHLGSAALQPDGKIVLLDISQNYGQTYEVINQVRNLLRYYGYTQPTFIALRK